MLTRQREGKASGVGYRSRFGLLLLPLLALGCCNNQEQVRRALLSSSAAAAAVATPHQAYRVGSPDVLTITIEGRPEPRRRIVEANGCIDLASLGGLRVEGLTTDEIAARVATLVQRHEAQVQVAVQEYRSQQVYLFGEVSGLQRAVAYQGPETVVDLLRRTGGITGDGAPAQVKISRNHLMEKPQPEIYHVDLHAILLKGDQRTNLIVQPYDQIYVPETKQARFGKCLHPMLRPLCWLIQSES